MEFVVEEDGKKVGTVVSKWGDNSYNLINQLLLLNYTSLSCIIYYVLLHSYSVLSLD